MSVLKMKRLQPGSREDVIKTRLCWKLLNVNSSAGTSGNRCWASAQRFYSEKPLGALNLCVSPQRSEIHRGRRKCVSEAAGVQPAQREERQQPLRQGQSAHAPACLPAQLSLAESGIKPLPRPRIVVEAAAVRDVVCVRSAIACLGEKQ